MTYPIWGILNKHDEVVAKPLSDGTVKLRGLGGITRAEWKEFKSQVDELFDIVELKDPA